MLVACSSNYHPVRSPRISMKMDSGGVVFVKDGREHSMGLIGSGLVEAVQGNRAAEEQARAFRNNLITGWTFYGVGLGLTFAGASVWALTGSEAPDVEPVGPALTLGGIALVFTGVAFFMRAGPLMYDTINLYNDGVDASLMPRLQLPPPPYAPITPVPNLPAPGSSPPPPATSVPPAGAVGPP